MGFLSSYHNNGTVQIRFLIRSTVKCETSWDTSSKITQRVSDVNRFSTAVQQSCKIIHSKVQKPSSPQASHQGVCSPAVNVFIFIGQYGVR